MVDTISRTLCRLCILSKAIVLGLTKYTAQIDKGQPFVIKLARFLQDPSPIFQYSIRNIQIIISLLTNIFIFNIFVFQYKNNEKETVRTRAKVHHHAPLRGSSKSILKESSGE